MRQIVDHGLIEVYTLSGEFFTHNLHSLRLDPVVKVSIFWTIRGSPTNIDIGQVIATFREVVWMIWV